MENNEILKKILLNMKYDSKKTLSENLDRTILNEGAKILMDPSGIEKYWKTLNSRLTTAGYPTKPINENQSWWGPFVFYKTDENASGRVASVQLKGGKQCKALLSFEATRSGKALYAGQTLDKFEITDTCDSGQKNLKDFIIFYATQMGLLTKSSGGGNASSGKKTDKKYLLRMRNNNRLGIAIQQLDVPSGVSIIKNGDILTIGQFQYNCSKKIFGIDPNSTTYSSSFGAVYESSDFAKFLDENHCKSTSKSSSFDWMAKNNNAYWQVLKTSLEKNDLVPYVKESSDAKQGSYYYWGKFVVWRNTPNKFITHSDTNVLGKISNYNGKYAGQNALSDIELILSNGEKSNVLDFITKYTSTISGRDSGIQNDPGKNKKPDYTPGDSNKPKNECKGTYSMGCITPEVGEAQQCLKDDGLYTYRVDNKFGSKTRDAIKAKIGKTYFTDADLQTICKTKKGGGGEDEYDFDKDMGGGSGGQEKEDTTWTGDVY